MIIYKNLLEDKYKRWYHIGMIVKKLKLMRNLCLVAPIVVMIILVTLWGIIAFLGAATGIEKKDGSQTTNKINNIEKIC